MYVAEFSRCNETLRNKKTSTVGVLHMQLLHHHLFVALFMTSVDDFLSSKTAIFVFGK